MMVNSALWQATGSEKKLNKVSQGYSNANDTVIKRLVAQ